jgi:hypothetical protein
MGFDPSKIKILKNAETAKGYPLSPLRLDQIQCVSNHAPWNGPALQIEDTLDFEPHFGWKGHIESERRMSQNR